MKRSLKELTGYLIETKDGKTARAKDFLFDEKQWMIRYLEADFGSWLSADRLLIPRVFLKPPTGNSRIFPTELRTSDIEHCPKIEDHLPVSRKYEQILYNHYKLNPYWGTPYVGATGTIYPPRPVKLPSSKLNEDDVDSILRSFNEIIGYEIESLDGKFGQIDDIIIDCADWQIVYLIIDTQIWVPWSKKVMISVEFLEEISYITREAKLKLKTETIKNAPEFDPKGLVDEKYEKTLFDYYSSSLLK